jgi:N-acetylglucosaminyl-diphospho-decaprenol L-rhamnosyltransferase
VRAVGGARVAIAVVSTNLRELLAPCLLSMQEEVDSGLAEVWVVDNASSDGSLEMVRSDFPWVNLIPLDRNMGYGRAVNLVAERSTTPWIAPANEDIELRPGALERLLQTGEDNADAAIVAPRLELPNGSTQHSVHPFPTLGVTALVNVGAHRLSRRLADRLCMPPDWDPARPREVPWAIATFMVIRRDAFEEVGGFSADQFIHAEDLDLGWRLARAGWKARFEPRATVFHVGSAATRKAFGEDLWPRWMAASYSWMARRRNLGVAWSVAVVNVAGALARWLVFGALAAVGGRRFAHDRDAARRWVSLHKTGLRRPRELLRQH